MKISKAYIGAINRIKAREIAENQREVEKDLAKFITLGEGAAMSKEQIYKRVNNDDMEYRANGSIIEARVIKGVFECGWDMWGPGFDSQVEAKEYLEGSNTFHPVEGEQ